MRLHAVWYVVACLLAGGVPAGAQTGGWKADCSGAAIPRRAAAGRVAGQPFVVEKAELSGGNQDTGMAKMDHLTYFLRLRQGREFFADREFMVFIATRLGERIDGRSFVVRPGSTFHQAGAVKVGNVSYPPIQGVHMSYRQPGQSLPKTEMSAKYTLRLVFGQRRGNQIPGQIYLCMADTGRSYVAGTFRALRVP